MDVFETVKKKYKEWFPKRYITVEIHERTVQQKVAFYVCLILLGSLFSYSVYCGITGQDVLPFLSQSKAIGSLVAEADNQTYSMVMSFIRSDKTHQIKYTEGFDCWDASIRMYRNALW